MDVGWVAVLRVVVEVSGALTTGGLLVALFLAPVMHNGALSGAGVASLRSAACAAGVWTGGLAALSAGGVTSWTGPTSAGCAFLVAVGCACVRRWSPTAALVAPAGVALLLPLVDAPVLAGAQGDLVGAALVWMVLAPAVWAGALFWVLLGLRRGHDVVFRRHGSLVRTCWLSAAAAGAVLALAREAVPLALTVAAIALMGLGGLAVLVRRRAQRADIRSTDAVLVRSLFAQAVLLVVLIVAVGRVARFPVSPVNGPLEAAAGYSLPGPLDWQQLLATWRPDLLLGPVALLAATAYVAGVRRLGRAGRPWPAGRTAAWMTGCALVLLATSSGVGAYAPAVFSVHMVLHMVLNMIAPLALVLGAPVTLALRALPAAPADRPAGPHEWLLATVGSPFARALAHPVLAASLFAGSYYLLYLTDLFEVVIAEHWSRTVLNAAILAIGYQFCWLVVGPDAAPRRLPHLGRLGLGFAVMPFHVLFAIIILSLPTAVAGGFYESLDLVWSPDLLADQRRAGLLSLVLGEVVLVVTQVVLLVQWHRHDQFAAFRADPLDEDATAYRDLLETLERNRRPAPPFGQDRTDT
ncbi:cytochrome c oxidase assembly protein [Pseudonocardia sp. KRD-184]|uniref:Cytochrome c oxidase assembly protein n=1 Tax=Pseudonocardia oceani TaxID=2792013 RepID=A0ABS6U3Q4_9PSEU|nr:cytochrome c oxidase assembly protein [Pseudonocardia oceani]MBW0088722.1 cytochrome c oxidase assembly protein [Pseudonocardia oceani]MBW0095661.1 cytochrome c oxidase assembly protein [Pseudonocardia oceani]MBW0121846.1 cytochrome c oxidase assembly protein [Pseudonocardia oceani]MBW0126598.1 cytochrome c oxidase assembly protein [Pseudonocardia oceani]